MIDVYMILLWYIVHSNQYANCSIRINAIEQLDFADRPRRMISAIEITVAKIQPGQSR